MHTNPHSPHRILYLLLLSIPSSKCMEGKYIHVHVYKHDSNTNPGYHVPTSDYMYLCTEDATSRKETFIHASLFSATVTEWNGLPCLDENIHGQMRSSIDCSPVDYNAPFSR